MKRRITVFLLAICITLGMIPLTQASAATSKGSDFTSGELAAHLDTIINSGISTNVTPSLPAVNSTFSKKMMYTVRFPGRSWRGYQCMAYAYAAYNAMFGADPYGADTVSFDSLVKRSSLGYQDFVNCNVKCGAYLRTTCNSNGSFHTSQGHSLLVLSYNASGVTYIEGNISGSVYSVNLKTLSWSDFNKYLLSGKGRYVNTLRQPADSVYNALLDKRGDCGSGHMEYRYGGYATTDGRHECWCETYLRNKFGSAVLRYTDWSETRYSSNGSSWTCGKCGGNHTGVSRYGNDRRAWWAEYTLPDGKDYYWEESRWVEDVVPARTYTVTLDSGSTCKHITVTNGGTYSGLTTPTRDGYTFDGWYTQETGGSKITDSTTVNLSGDQTLYAHWTQNAHVHEKINPTIGPDHPHYTFYTCTCGEVFTENETNRVTGCKDCSTERWVEKVSTTPVVASDTIRNVWEETVEVSPARTEYRYGGYVCYDSRKHECWCATYMTKLFGSATLRYSDWSTTRYTPGPKGWTCGDSCRGNHIGVAHYTNGKPWWAEYLLPDGNDYYWEESRVVPAQTETRYHYEERVPN